MKSIARRIIVTLLTLEARLVLWKYRPRIVAITGSVGKTTTKDAVYTVLANAFYVRKSAKSFNSEIGVPLTILGCENAWNNPMKWLRNLWEGILLLTLKNHYPQWLVLEVGADRPGDIQQIAHWLQPDVAVITRVPDVPVHIEFFSSPEALAQEKQTLAEALREDGALVLNYDDERVRAIKSRVRRHTMTYGFSEEADVQASHEDIHYEGERPAGVTFRVEHEGNSVPITLSGVLGIQYMYAALAALTVGATQGLNLVSAGQALSETTFAPGRMRLLSGISGSLIIDDSYNASPAALEAALDTLATISVSGRTIVVLGDMLELGTHMAQAHKQAGEHVARIADGLITVGVRARHAAQAARDAGMPEADVQSFDDAATAGEALATRIEEGDVILVKGSQSMRMERVVEQLLQDPTKARNLLVRQEPEWSHR